MIPRNAKDFQFSNPKEGLPFSIYYPNNETMRIAQNLTKKTKQIKVCSNFLEVFFEYYVNITQCPVT